MTRKLPHKHLTTPWVANGAYVFAGNDCIAICDTDNADEATYEAKARLIAAAPALIAALEQARLAITYALGARENEMIAMAAEAHCKLALDAIRDATALTAARGASADTGER